MSQEKVEIVRRSFELVNEVGTDAFISGNFWSDDWVPSLGPETTNACNGEGFSGQRDKVSSLARRPSASRYSSEMISPSTSTTGIRSR